MTGHTNLLKSASAVQALGAAAPDYARTLVLNDKLSDAAFANGDRRFPIHDKSATYHSHALALVEGADTKTASIIRDAGVAHGIDEDLTRMTQVVDAYESSQAAAEKSAAVEPDPNLNYHALPSRGLYPINTMAALEDSARKVASVIPKLTAKETFEACNNILNNADYFKLARGYLPEVIETMGELRVPDAATVNIEIDARLKRADASWHDAYEAVRKVAMGIDIYGPEIIELAEVLADTDKQAGLQSMWGMELNHPVAVILSGPTHTEVSKLASHMVLLAGVPVPVAAVRSIPQAILDVECTKVARLCAEAIVANDGDTNALREIENFIPRQEQVRLAKLAALHS